MGIFEYALRDDVRCSSWYESEIAPVQCREKEGHGGPHEFTANSLYAVWTDELAIPKPRPEGDVLMADTLEAAARTLVESLSNYYFHEDDEELEAVNRVRRLLGMREQLPKCCEAEAQADIAEGKNAPPDHASYHTHLHGPRR